MRIQLSKRAVAQGALTVALLAVLYLAFVARPQRPGAALQGVAQRMLRPFGSDDGDPSQERLEELRTLPTFREAERSLGELNAARAGLLNAAAADDVEATRGAATGYHRRLEQVRLSLATLKSYLDPAEFQRCLQDLFMPHTEAEVGGAAIQESFLGLLPRVSILPEEILP